MAAEATLTGRQLLGIECTYRAALKAAQLPPWLTWHVAVNPLRRRIGFMIEQDGVTVTIVAPPNVHPSALVLQVRTQLEALQDAVGVQVPRQRGGGGRVA